MYKQSCKCPKLYPTRQYTRIFRQKKNISNAITGKPSDNGDIQCSPFLKQLSFIKLETLNIGINRRIDEKTVKVEIKNRQHRF